MSANEEAFATLKWLQVASMVSSGFVGFLGVLGFGLGVWGEAMNWIVNEMLIWTYV